jgi:hypothetical protein
VADKAALDRSQEDLAAILPDRVPAHLGTVAARAAAAILTTVTAMIDEATRLWGAGQPPEQIAATLTDTVGRALNILTPASRASAAPSE